MYFKLKQQLLCSWDAITNALIVIILIFVINDTNIYF